MLTIYQLRLCYDARWIPLKGIQNSQRLYVNYSYNSSHYILRRDAKDGQFESFGSKTVLETKQNSPVEACCCPVYDHYPTVNPV